jgi:predicted dehydrogenase
LKFGIVGCGLIGRKRAESIRRLGIDCAGFADISTHQADLLASEFGGVAVSSAEELMAHGCDGIVVATDHGSLAPIAISALERGIPVLAEKPGGKCLQDVKSIKSANGKNVPISIGFNHRFHPSFLKIRELISRGDLGELMYVRARYGHGGRIGYEKEWRCQKVVSGGGELIDQGAHLVDLSMWFLGEMQLDYAHLPTLYWNADVEDNCFLALKGAGKRFAWLHATWTEWKNIFSFEITGRSMKAVVSGLGGSYGVERLAMYRLLPGLGPPETMIEEFPFADTSWDLEVENFSLAIRDRVPLIGDIDDAIRMHTIIENAYTNTGLLAR